MMPLKNVAKNSNASCTIYIFCMSLFCNICYLAITSFEIMFIQNSSNFEFNSYIFDLGRQWELTSPKINKNKKQVPYEQNFQLMIVDPLTVSHFPYGVIHNVCMLRFCDFRLPTPPPLAFPFPLYMHLCFWSTSPHPPSPSIQIVHCKLLYILWITANQRTTNIKKWRNYCAKLSKNIASKHQKEPWDQVYAF